MNTRMSLWKKYRESIEKNISLQKSVKRSNEKLNILHKRLLKILPDYDHKYPSKLSKFKADVKNITKVNDISSENINTLLEEIEKIENVDDSSFSAIDKIEFDSGDLKDIIEKLKRENDITKYVNISNNKDLTMNKTRKVNLGGKNE
ncbi:MAG: hypothetical protein HRT99_02030 [Mycoplasmatales bacterium]|nr:hypothetical protein [Mycoplasmatales bacterium]